ncbi:hypothetical protein [Modestobacter altitudinis]|uniref:hypothetical protein n=1 Tax=Modestobacter altitudinis TaxID=2213158 RepID=UPI00110C96CF|nr:hypothetical protein [Modestobacter altitudinis]
MPLATPACWAGAPADVRAVARGAVLVLVYGTAVHLVQLVGSGFDPYPDLPGWLRAYFVSLTVLDPLAAVLLARRRRSGVALTVAVLATDALANGWANYALDPAAGVTAGRVGQAVISVLALVAVLTSRRLWRYARGGPESGRRDAGVAAVSRPRPEV